MKVAVQREDFDLGAEVRASLTRIKGVGPWTADIYLLMVLKRPDIWPNGDVALATAAMNLKQLASRPTFAQLAQMAESWRPFRSVAARMLWQYYLAQRKTRPLKVAKRESILTVNSIGG